VSNELNLSEIAASIQDLFTPYAFKCECNGSDPTCASIRQNDAYARAQFETVNRIADHLRKMGGGQA